MEQHYFNGFVARHGESGVQAIIERIERYEGIRPTSGSTLEDRWNVIMSDALVMQRLAA